MLQLIGPAVGAAIALVGVVVAQYWQDRRDRARRAQEREDASIERIFDRRCDAHLQLLTALEEALDHANEAQMYNRAPPDTERMWDALSKKRVSVEVFGSQSAADASEVAMRAVINAAETSKTDPWKAARKAISDYRAAIRLDLGVRD